MAKITRRTLKIWANRDLKGARKEMREIISKDFPGYIETKSLGGTFRDEPESYGCDKLIIYAWYSRGCWSDATKEIFARFYLPKKSA